MYYVPVIDGTRKNKKESILTLMVLPEKREIKKYIYKQARELSF